MATELPSDVGPYQILKKLQERGLTSEYLAQHRALKRKVRLRVLTQSAAMNPTTVERFRRGANVQGTVHHPNIAPVVDTGDADGILYTATAFVEGTYLSELIRDKGPMAPTHAAQLIGRVAGALQRLHDQGIVHRDIKPSNILVQPDDEPMLTDLSLLIQTNEQSLEPQWALVGTLSYMPPESWEDAPPAPARDVYALGVALYQTLTGQLPFKFEGGTTAAALEAVKHAVPAPPSSLVSSIPSGLDAICLQCLVKDPERRPSARDLAKVLAGDLTINPYRKSTPTTGFSASAALASLAVKGLGDRHSPHDMLTPTTGPTGTDPATRLKDVSVAISERVERVLANLAYEAGGRGQAHLPISEGERLTRPAYDRLLASLSLDAARAEPFFTALLGELTQLAASDSFSGDWGRLTRGSSGLVLEAAPLQRLPADRPRAKVVARYRSKPE